MLTVLVIGALFAGVLMGMYYLGEAANDMRASASDSSIQMQLSSLGNLSLDEKIARFSAALGTVKTQQTQEWVAKNLADLYVQQGDAILKTGDIPAAAVSYGNATKVFQKGAPAYSRLGDLYRKAALSESNESRREQQWLNALTNYRFAYQSEQDPIAKAKFGNLAAESTCYYITVQSATGISSNARDLLYEARQMATPSSEVANRVQALLNQLSGG